MKKILVGLDGSQNSFKALNEAIYLSQFYNAELHTISVGGTPRLSETAADAPQRGSLNGRFNPYIEKARQMAADQNCRIYPHVFAGHEVKTIIDFIWKNQIDYLIVGSAIYETMMGGLTLSLVRMSPCDVLVVK